MARYPASLFRRAAKFKPQPTVLVICEDSKSGRTYLEDASIHFRVNIHVDVTHCGKTDPKSIVLEAIARQKHFERVFCVIDRDAHSNFDEALKLAKEAKSLEVIPSYPCFEFWLLLHYGFTRKPHSAVGKESAADRLVRELKSCAGLESYAKGGDQALFRSLLGAPLAQARKFSPKVLEDAYRSGEMNPSTKIHQLIDYFESLATPRPVDS